MRPSMRDCVTSVVDDFANQQQHVRWCPASAQRGGVSGCGRQVAPHADVTSHVVPSGQVPGWQTSRQPGVLGGGSLLAQPPAATANATAAATTRIAFMRRLDQVAAYPVAWLLPRPPKATGIVGAPVCRLRWAPRHRDPVGLSERQVAARNRQRSCQFGSVQAAFGPGGATRRWVSRAGPGIAD